jgi:hypothetical protein
VFPPNLKFYFWFVLKDNSLLNNNCLIIVGKPETKAEELKVAEPKKANAKVPQPAKNAAPAKPAPAKPAKQVKVVDPKEDSDDESDEDDDEIGSSDDEVFDQCFI